MLQITDRSGCPGCPGSRGSLSVSLEISLKFIKPREACGKEALDWARRCLSGGQALRLLNHMRFEAARHSMPCNIMPCNICAHGSWKCRYGTTQMQVLVRAGEKVWTHNLSVAQRKPIEA